MQEAVKGAIILAVLERLLLTRHSNWLEVRRCCAGRSDACMAPEPPCLRLTRAQQEHIDYLSLQSLLFKQTALSFSGQLRLFFRHTRRIAD